eukprot:5265325-Alexandrium_andersonii.AAC.1
MAGEKWGGEGGASTRTRAPCRGPTNEGGAQDSRPGGPPRRSAPGHQRAREARPTPHPTSSNAPAAHATIPAIS